MRFSNDRKQTHRTFNGLRFEYIDMYDSKEKADKEATDYKADGYTTKVLKDRSYDMWNLYIYKA